MTDQLMMTITNATLTFVREQLTLKEVELVATREERDVARRDVEDTHLAKDEIIRRAWEVRDQAAARKNAAEIDLARTRIEALQSNSQLLETIQQKIELSQQLEQWQVGSLSFSNAHFHHCHQKIPLNDPNQRLASKDPIQRSHPKKIPLNDANQRMTINDAIKESH